MTTLSALPNEGVVEYWLSMPTSANQYDAGPFPMTTLEPISTSSLYSGQVMTVQMAATASVNVGNLTGTMLYTAVSNAIMSACTDVPPPLPTSGLPTASVTTCGDVPKISDIIYADDSGGWYTGGELELDVGLVKYYDMQSLEGMVASVAAAVNGSSMNPSSSWSPSPHCSWPVGKFGQECDASDIGNVYPTAMVNVPAIYQVIFSQDTAEMHDWPVQNINVGLAFGAEGGAFECANDALVMDALAGLALLPGLEWLAFMAVPALGVSATCDAVDNQQNGD